MATIQERRGRDGRAAFRAIVRVKGSPPASATFPRKTDARRWAQQTEAKIREGRHFPDALARTKTLSELIDRYLAEPARLQERSIGDKRRQLVWWRQQIGHMLLSEVRPGTISECRDRLLSGDDARGRPRSGATVNRYLAALSHAFSVAVREWEWVSLNPVKQISRSKESAGRERYLTKDETAALIAACESSASPLLLPLVVVAISTGMRLGEILQLRWCDVDLSGRRLRVSQSKNGEVRFVPLEATAHDLIAQRARGGRDSAVRVFDEGTGGYSFRKHWSEALGRAGLVGLRFHDLRHTAASHFANSGASSAQIAELLGHKTLQMVKRYTHFSSADMSRLVGDMNKSMFAE